MGSWTGVFAASPGLAQTVGLVLLLQVVSHTSGLTARLMLARLFATPLHAISVFHAIIHARSRATMPTITLDKIRSDIEAKYAPVVIELGETKVTLVQVLRLDKETRKALMQQEKDREKAQEENAEFDEDATLEHLRNVLRLVATNDDEIELLLAEVGDDLVLLSEIVNAWREGTQAGEASSSAS